MDSILSQTYQKIEVILVNDGSSDESGRICDAYAASDTRVKVAHQSNGGVSKARNTGLGLASGDYICFVDSDDWIDPDYFAKAVDILSKKRPASLLNNFMFDRGDHKPYAIHHAAGGQFFGSSAIFEMIKQAHFGWEAVASFYRADLCRKVQFPEHIVYGEDLYFKYSFFKECNSSDDVHIYVPLQKYHYRVRGESAVGSLSIVKKQDDLQVIRKIMTEQPGEISELAYYRAYLPVLILHCIQGGVSGSAEERKLSAEMKKELRAALSKVMYGKAAPLSVKLKLLVAMLPSQAAYSVFCFYKWMGSFKRK